MFKVLTVLTFLSLGVFAVLADDGSCGCSRGTKTGQDKDSSSEACRQASLKCDRHYSSDCVEGCVCTKPASECASGYTVNRGFPRIETGGSGDPKWKCRVTCHQKSFRCVKPGAVQDPHFTDFTGNRFDFHGVHGDRYVMLARDGGDTLVAEMVAKKLKDPLTNTVKHRTYFAKFGLRTSVGDKVLVKIGKQWRAGKNRWVAVVERNGETVNTDMNKDEFSVKFSPDNRVAHIKTKEMGYSFTAVPRRTQERLDFHVSLIRKPKETDRFMGVLGMSLNKRIGHGVRYGLMKEHDLHPEDLEFSLREQFQVKHLHPEVKEVTEMHGIIHLSKTKLKGSFKKISATSS